MRAGLSTYTYTWAVGVPGAPVSRSMTAVDLVRHAAEVGVTVVQLADNLALHTASADELDELESVAGELGVSIEVGTRGIGVHLDRYVALAQRFGSPFVRIVLDQRGDRPTPADALRRLSTYQRVFEDAEVSLAIENHDRFSCEQLAELVTTLGRWAGICLDTVNSLGALEGPEQVVSVLGPLAINLHVKDFTIFRPSHAMGFVVQGTPAGAGMLNIPWLLQELADSAVSTAILELWTPQAETVAKSISREREWAEQSLTFLRSNTDLEFAAVP